MGIPKERAFVLMSLTHNLMRGMAISRLWGTSATINDELIEHWRTLVLHAAKPGKQPGRGTSSKSRAKRK
jgi:hypothetical protein